MKSTKNEDLTTFSIINAKSQRQIAAEGRARWKARLQQIKEEEQTLTKDEDHDERDNNDHSHEGNREVVAVMTTTEGQDEANDETASTHSHGTRSSTRVREVKTDKGKDQGKKVKEFVKCDLCSKEFKKRKDGKPHAHNCEGVGGAKNCSDVISGRDGDQPSQLAKTRERARAKTSRNRELKGLPPKTYDIEVDDGDQYDHELNPRKTVFQKDTTTTRTQRRREMTKIHFLQKLKELVKDAAEDNITKGEFTEAIERINNLTPNDAKRAPMVDNTEEMKKKTEQAQKEQDERHEEEDMLMIHENSDHPKALKNGAMIEKEKTRRILKQVHKHMSNFDMRKARNVINGVEVYPLEKEYGRNLLKSNHPEHVESREERAKYADSLENQRKKDEMVTENTNIVDAERDLVNYIHSRKKGASNGATGHSHDHFKSLIKKYPEASRNLAIVSARLAEGNLVDGNAKEGITFGKGTALKKGSGNDLRGITSCNPLQQYAGTIKTKAEHENIKSASGKEQLVMEKGGVELNGHVITFLVESQPNKVAAVLDLFNAYGNMDQAKSLELIEQSVPGLGPFSRMQMTGSTTKTSFHDRKSGQVQIVSLEKGVAQGGTASSAQFCVVLHQAVTKKLAEEFEEIEILSISDNITVFGELEMVCDVIERATELIETGMGGRLQPTKTTIYGSGKEYKDEAIQRAQQLGVKWIGAEEGFECAGTPIGSEQYKINKAEEKADGIIAEIEKITVLATSDNSNIGNTVQTMMAIMRVCETSQLSFLSRVLPRRIMQHAAKRVDRAIINAVAKMTQTTKLLAPMNSEKLEKQIEQLFLPVRFGGIGLQSAERALEGSFVGSIVQCGERMAEICPQIRELIKDNQLTPSLRDFNDQLDELKSQEIKAVEELDINNIWDKSKLKMQRLINQEIQQRSRDRMMEDLPAETIGCDGDKEGITERYIMLNNEDKNASAWLTANAGIHYNKMSNEDYSMSIALRLRLNVMESRTHCVCGEMTDKFGQHAHSCAAAAVRAGQRNALHSLLETKTRMILNMGRDGGNHLVAIGKPRVDRFLTPRTAGGGQASAKSFSDIEVTSTTEEGGTAILYDVTTSDTLADYVQDHIKKSENPYTPGVAGTFGEKRKEQHYNALFFTDQPVAGPTRMETICIETTGAWGAETTRCLKEMADNITRGEQDAEQQDGTSPTEATSMKLRQITQIFSVSLQAWRAQTVRRFIKYFTLDSRPMFPYVPGSRCAIPRPDPPAFSSPPFNRTRTHAMTPLPARHPPGLHRRLVRT